jgi:hypothetical protein|tara:strand:+ start:63 stop:962 length:900 start_codon:yes stop_codon:yes gene_type:complete
MKKDKFPIITALELINKKKVIFGFDGGDLYKRSKDKLGEFGWADKWEDIHNCLKIIYPLLKNLANNQTRKKITGFGWHLAYGVPKKEQIKEFRKNNKYKRLNKDFFHGISPIYYNNKKLWVAADLFTESYIWKNGKYGLGIYIIKIIANLIDDLEQINFVHYPLGEGWLVDHEDQEDYIRMKLKNYSWTNGAIDISNKSYKNKKFLTEGNKTRKEYGLNFKNTYKGILKNEKHPKDIALILKKKYAKEMKGNDYGRDKEALVYLRKNINKKVKFNFNGLFGTPDEHKKDRAILKKYKII